jgi:starch synthase (maltosyl-transferring)
VICDLRPQVDGGRRPAKTTVGEEVLVEANAFADGQEELWCELRSRHVSEKQWSTVPMTSDGNDHWRAAFPISQMGGHRFLVRARPDRFALWVHQLRSRVDDGQSVEVELLVGAELVQQAAGRAKGRVRRLLLAVEAELLTSVDGLSGDAPDPLMAWTDGRTLGEAMFSPLMAQLMGQLGDPDEWVTSDTLPVIADRARARFSSWYEMFPRSASPEPGRAGTLSDVRARLAYVADMGFDVLYLPPIHPIGHTDRKGRNGAAATRTEDPGSPWAIGSAAGGHDAVHPELGTQADVVDLVRDARDLGIDIALDLAFQASPDHPWVTQHPEWFRHRPDGSIRYAENPPKRYEDIYPFDFETTDWRALWEALRMVVEHWIGLGVSIFRVDNPHTKPFPFWEWLIDEIRSAHPEVIFLAEAFTRPRIMEHLAKIGFTQSYTYFTWRSTKWELESYLEEVTHGAVAEYFRPNFWPTTPDILTEEIQHGGRAAFLSRLVLAATLSSNYGLYGPTFELQEHEARSGGSEEFLHSEKYEVRHWELDRSDSLAAFIGRVNRIRRQHEALQFTRNLAFHGVDNDQLLIFSKCHEDDVLIVIVNLDHHAVQSGWVNLDLDRLGLDPGRPYVMHDLLTGARYPWQGDRNFVRLDPAAVPCHVFVPSQDGS